MKKELYKQCNKCEGLMYLTIKSLYICNFCGYKEKNPSEIEVNMELD